MDQLFRQVKWPWLPRQPSGEKSLRDDSEDDIFVRILSSLFVALTQKLRVEGDCWHSFSSSCLMNLVLMRFS